MSVKIALSAISFVFVCQADGCNGRHDVTAAWVASNGLPECPDCERDMVPEDEAELRVPASSVPNFVAFGAMPFVTEQSNVRSLDDVGVANNPAYVPWEPLQNYDDEAVIEMIENNAAIVEAVFNHGVAVGLTLTGEALAVQAGRRAIAVAMVNAAAEDRLHCHNFNVSTVLGVIDEAMSTFNAAH